MKSGILVFRLYFRYFQFFIGIIIFCSFLSSQSKSECLPIDCTTAEITKMAKGGLTADEIKKFCRNFGEEKATKGLREKYGMLEGKNWRTHYIFQQEREKVFFTVSVDMIQLQSNNPQVQYFGMEDLGDSIRFQRKERPYKAIYTLTISKDHISENSLIVSQQYRKVSKFTWKAE